MKYLGLILVVALVAGQVLAARINGNDSPLEHSRVKRGVNDRFRDFLENLKNTLREGNATLGIPPLDPFNHDELNLLLDDNLVKGSARVSDFIVEGLADYNVDTAGISILSRKITIGLTWPKIYSEGSYGLDLSVSDFDVFCDGTYTVTAEDLSFHTIVKLGIVGGVKIKEISTKIRLGHLEFVATGLSEDEDTSKFISAIVSDAAPQIIQDYQRELTDVVNEKVSEYVNKKLEGKSISEILAIIS